MLKQPVLAHVPALLLVTLSDAYSTRCPSAPRFLFDLPYSRAVRLLCGAVNLQVDSYAAVPI